MHPAAVIIPNQESHLQGKVLVKVGLIILFIYLWRKYLSSRWGRKRSRKVSEQVLGKGIKPKYYVTKVSHSPIKIPILDGAITLYKLNKYGVRMTEDYARKFGQGGVFSIAAGPELIYAITDANITYKILSSSNPDHLNKPMKLYNLLFEWLKGGLVNSPYQKWSAHRKILNRAFTYKSLQTYLKLIMNKHAKNLAKDLIMKKDAQEEIKGKEMYDLIYFHTIKIVSQILLGDESCTDEESSEFHEKLHEYKHCAVYRFRHPQLLLHALWMLHPKKRVFDELIKWCNEFALTIINRYKVKTDLAKAQGLQLPENEAEVEENTAGWNYGSDSIKKKEDDDGIKEFRCLLEEMLYSGLSDKAILDEIGTFMSAGHETTSMALQMLMFNLALNPAEQSRCHEEVDALFNSKLVSSDFDYDLNVDDLSDLKHLERCIFESSRLTPTVPIFARKLDAPLKIDDSLEFKGNTTVVLIPWVVHRDPRHYPDPERFDPDRFLPENAKKRPPGSYLPFSGGPRNCIGWKVALLEMKVIMAWLLRYFEIYTTDGPNDVKLSCEVTLDPERPHNIILKKRSRN